MGARTKARKRALDILFEADQRGANAQQLLERRLIDSGAQTPLPAYTAELVRGVISRWLEINDTIASASHEWTIERMPAVDRAILRLATWEIVCNDEVATAVAIDEALTLAGDLSTDESPKFINGILSTIVKEAPAFGSTGGGVFDATAPLADQLARNADQLPSAESVPAEQHLPTEEAEPLPSMEELPSIESIPSAALTSMDEDLGDELYIPIDDDGDEEDEVAETKDTQPTSE